MNITFYQNISEHNKMGKTLTNPLSLNGNLKDECDILNPSILVEGNVIAYNYLYIPDFSRYYFITGVTCVRNNLFRVDCHVDVLETYQTQIKNIGAILDRQEHLYNMYLYDNELAVETDTFTLTDTFDNSKSFDIPNYVIVSS